MAKFRCFFCSHFFLYVPGAEKKDEATIVALTVMKMGALDPRVIQLSNEQKNRLIRVYIEDEILPNYVGIKTNQPL